jgi:hypothetical protein
MIAAAAAASDPAQAQSATQILTAGCADDARKFCAGVSPGGGRIIACLKQNQDSLSPRCKQAAAQAAQLSGASPTAAAPPAAVSSPAVSSPAEGAATSRGKPTASAADGSYLVLKKVQVSGPGPDAARPTLPAFDLLIPSTWTLQGGVTFGGSPSGCFADMYALSLKASSPDQTTAFAAGPDYSWQYADDPSVQKSLNDPTRRALGVGGKPCQVARPMKAEDYIRQNVLKVYPAGTTVVSVAPFSELEQILRRRQGLPPGADNAGATHIEAIRVRLAYAKDGTDLEAWVAVGVVVNIYPAGRGSFYDSHATSLVAFSAPKGRLDANDKLFQVITSSLQPEAPWVSYSGGVLAKLYQAQAQKAAAIDQAWAQFYTHAAQTINGVTAHAMRGADASVFHADQNIRGVQTFRDPATGRTQELSNLYDHAWQNGSDEYVMSNDPNFNPNQSLSANWNELQAVNP